MDRQDGRSRDAPCHRNHRQRRCPIVDRQVDAVDHDYRVDDVVDDDDDRD